MHQEVSFVYFQTYTILLHLFVKKNGDLNTLDRFQILRRLETLLKIKNIQNMVRIKRIKKILFLKMCVTSVYYNVSKSFALHLSNNIALS